MNLSSPEASATCAPLNERETQFCDGGHRKGDLGVSAPSATLTFALAARRMAYRERPYTTASAIISSLSATSPIELTTNRSYGLKLARAVSE